MSRENDEVEMNKKRFSVVKLGFLKMHRNTWEGNSVLIRRNYEEEVGIS